MWRPCPCPLRRSGHFEIELGHRGTQNGDNSRHRHRQNSIPVARSRPAEVALASLESWLLVALVRPRTSAPATAKGGFPRRLGGLGSG